MKHPFKRLFKTPACAALLTLSASAWAQSINPDLLPSSKTKPAPLADLATFQDCADCPVMVALPLSGFYMGSDPKEQGRRKGLDDDEGDGKRWVQFKQRFAMGQTEVSG
jgi:hypothetical protein